MQRALDLATPSRAHLAAWAGFTAAAAYWQQQTSGVRATAVAAGQSIRVLDGDVNRLARTFPIGTAGAVQMVQAVQSLGATEKQIGPLANVMERLSGATGFGPELAVGFGQLNREMANLDPARVQRFSDVLTTVAARSGASAMGIVSFAQSIAPVAQQAGIGESAVLGISSAFVKLGEDGGAAATAVNKILGDLNRSVREGSSDMTAYAQITGMTVHNFKQLYQTNPAQTVAAVTAAIGRAGPQGQMLLESLGLEGVRTQRALLQLSQSGGLDQAVSQATGAYGNNSTSQAAKQAFGGLNDSLTELRSTAGQTADALGGPFLHVLTQITDLAKIGLAPVNAILGSGPGQNAIGALGGLAVTGLLARRVIRPLGSLALGYQAATSGPIRSLFGGYATGRAGGDIEAALATRAGRFGADPIAAAQAGDPYGRTFMQRINAGFLGAGQTLGGAREAAFGPMGAPTAGGPGLVGLLRGAGRTGVTASSMAYEAWARSFADPFKQASTPTGQRLSLLQPEAGGLFSRANQVRQEAGIRAALGMLQKEGGGSAAALGRLSSATLGATKAVTTFAGGTLRAGAMAGSGLLRGVGGSALSFLGGPVGLALLGGGLAYSAYQSSQSSKHAEQDRMFGLDMYSALNSYRDSIGQAGEASVSLADQFSSAAATIAKAVTSFPRAQQVTSQDISALGPNPSPKSNQVIYRGSDTQIAGQISSLNLGGLQPGDLQAVKMDLLRQGMPPGRVESILRQVNTKQGGQVSPSTISGLVGGVASEAGSYRWSLAEQIKRHPLPAGNMSDFDLIGSGSVGSKPLVGDDGKKTLDLLQGAIMQQYADLSDHYSKGFVVQRQIRTANMALREAVKSGNPDTIAAVAQRVGISLTGDKGFTVSARAVMDAGGDITKLVGSRNIYGQTADYWRTHGVTSSGAGLAPQMIDSGAYVNLRQIGASALLPFFANAQQRGYSGAQRAVGQFGLEPASASAQLKAVNAMVEASSHAGVSLTDLAVQATKASSVTADWQQQLVQAVAAEAQFEQQVRLQGAGRGQLLSAAVTTDLRYIAAGPGTDPNGDQAKKYAEAKSDLSSQRQSLIEYYQSRVMAQYQFQIQSERSQEDYQRQVGRSEEDFQRGRFREFRDFNIQMARAAQDAAANMYDPYQRIAVQPVFDAVNLQSNVQEEIQAMRQQVVNIRRLRGLGLDDAAIRFLKLYDPRNAQQVAQLVLDLQGDSTLAGQFNKDATQRQNLGRQLLSQDPSFQRQRQDFRRQLGDQQKDFGIAQDRTRTDFLISQSRMAQDLAIQDLQITNSMTKLSKDMSDIIHGRFVDLHRQVVNSLTSTQDAVSRIWPSINNTLLHPGSAQGGTGATTSGGVSAAGGTAGGGYGNAAVGGGRGPATTLEHGLGGGGAVVAPNQYVKPGTGEVYHGKMRSTGLGISDYRPADAFIQLHPADPNFNRSIAKRMRPDWAKTYWADWDALWTTESGWNQYADNPHSDAYGIPQSLPGTKMAGAGGDWRTNPSTQIRWGIDYIAGRYGNPAKAMAHENNYGWYGSGGVFDKPTIAGIGERGPEAAIPLNAHGMQFMVSALRQYVGSADAKLIGSGGLSHATHVRISSDTYNYDQGQHFHGPMTVKANSPRELKEQLEAKRRMDNLTGTRGVAWQGT